MQNILHNISHKHLLTVPNTVGSVSSPSVPGCQENKVFFIFGYISASSQSCPSPLGPPSCTTVQNLHSLDEDVVHQQWTWLSGCCGLLFVTEKVTHYGVNPQVKAVMFGTRQLLYGHFTVTLKCQIFIEALSCFVMLLCVEANNRLTYFLRAKFPVFTCRYTN